jgi:hypothetical protein
MQTSTFITEQIKIMKINAIPILFPALLGGCSLSAFHRPAVSDAQPYVDELITRNLAVIRQAQNDLKQTTTQTTSHSPAIPSPRPTDKRPSPAPTLAASQGLANVKQSGTPETFSLVRVNARNQELEKLLYKVVPRGWKVNLSADLKSKFRQRISLNDNDQWPHVLDKLLREHNLAALLEWEEQQISVTYRTSKISTATAKTPVTSPAIQTSAEESEKKVTSPTPSPGFITKQVTKKPEKITPTAPAAALSRAWSIAAGSTLKDGLMVWASQAVCQTQGISHWTLQWETPLNYRIDAPLHFYGDFDAALNGVFSLYQHAQRPLYAARILSQCLIRVNDKAWAQK